MNRRIQPLQVSMMLKRVIFMDFSLLEQVAWFIKWNKGSHGERECSVLSGGVWGLISTVCSSFKVQIMSLILYFSFSVYLILIFLFVSLPFDSLRLSLAMQSSPIRTQWSEPLAPLSTGYLSCRLCRVRR